jgi:hypothetical protein
MAQAYNRPQDLQTPLDVKISDCDMTAVPCDSRLLCQESVTIRVRYTLVVKQSGKGILAAP